MTGNNPNLDLVHMNICIKFWEILSYLISKILSSNEILMLTKIHNSVTNLLKMTGNDPNLNLVNIIAYTKFGKILSFFSQDIKRKRNSE